MGNLKEITTWLDYSNKLTEALLTASQRRSGNVSRCEEFLRRAAERKAAKVK